MPGRTYREQLAAAKPPPWEPFATNEHEGVLLMQVACGDEQTVETGSSPHPSAPRSHSSTTTGRSPLSGKIDRPGVARYTGGISALAGATVMTVPIKVFVCYKKILAGDRPNEKAAILHFVLKEDADKYDPWIDDSGFSAGVAWETEIYRRLIASDVLLLMVGLGTSESPWVQREIALATALGISVVPLGFDLTRNEMVAELKAMEIDHLQGNISQNIKLNTRSALLAELSADLHAARNRTVERQKETLHDLVSRRNPPLWKADDKQKAATFDLGVHGYNTSIHVASGDISRVRGIDVLVNSENDYMQMARFFESKTVSSTLRRRGAQTRNGRYEDTIQQELDHVLRDKGRPVQVAEVFVTSAGGPGSDLVKVNKSRYIFHVVAVQSVAAAGVVIPFKQPDQIEACVRASLERFGDLNRAKGIVSPAGTEQRREQEARAEGGFFRINSIIFPLFGAGQGGSPTLEVIAPMIAGIKGYFGDQDKNDDLPSDIFISTYQQHEFEDVLMMLKKDLG
jgi:O-acetyl-ADP-ribose deacetylase (regulator of RNase III)